MDDVYQIGIICLANGPYAMFIDPLIENCEKYFLLGYGKKYFIITDNKFLHKGDNNCKAIFKQRNGFPLDCLLRPQYAYELKDDLQKLSYVYFLNSNIFMRTEIGEEILPDKSGLVGVQHPGFASKDKSQFTYDRNPQSLACIPM